MANPPRLRPQGGSTTWPLAAQAQELARRACEDPFRIVERAGARLRRDHRLIVAPEVDDRGDGAVKPIVLLDRVAIRVAEAHPLCDRRVVRGVVTVEAVHHLRAEAARDEPAEKEVGVRGALKL